jgi:FkbM family methyltransferase
MHINVNTSFYNDFLVIKNVSHLQDRSINMNPKVSIIDVASGKFMIWSTNDALGRMLLKDGIHEPTVIKLSEFIIRNSIIKNVLDIGANIGSWSIPLAIRLDENAVFNCFEIQKVVFYQLCGNIFLNRLTNVFAHNVGVSNVSRRSKIPAIDYNKCWNVGGYSIDPLVTNAPRTDFQNNLLVGDVEAEFKTIDSLEFLPKSCLVKIDVEGHELEVISGALNHLEFSGWPPIIFESWDFDWYKEKRDALLQYLRSIGYENISIDIGYQNYLAQHKHSKLKKVKIEKIENSFTVSIE